MGLEEDRRIAHSLEKIATCAELLAQILNDNRKTINRLFKIEEDILDHNEEIMKLREDLKKANGPVAESG